MSTNHWDTILPIFDAVRDVPAPERDALLAQRCGEDAVLRAEVESLLSHDDRAADGFLKAGAGVLPTAPSDGPDPLIGATVASYTIKSVIAAGGMGTVYLAEQSSPRREVALKVLSSGLWSKSAERRFEFESQVLARLRHPNIAQVYEAGTHRLETGATVHYFAMEYIPNARTITDYANEARLGIRERLDLFLQACDAVQHGHQKGIIHRDLKPGNILVGTEADMIRAATVRERSPRNREGPVDEHPPLPHGRGSDRAQPLVKIIDFGIARATDSDVAATTMHTETGALIGTLAYMSPEQCDADPLGIDTRSDVYSLGVVLYELLCGRLPYDVSRTSIVKAARTICDQPPGLPSRITGGANGLQAVRGDLEFLLLKALEKDRTRRVQSAEALAADLGRYLRGEPIEARPPTLFVKTIRWAAKRKKLTTSAVAVLLGGFLTFAAGLVVQDYTFRQPHRIEMAKDRSAVELLARSGLPLHSWNSGEPSGIAGAELLTDLTSTRRLAIIGFTFYSRIFTGQLFAFDIDADPSRPVWSRRVQRDDMPADLEQRGPAVWDFGVAAFLVADVFPGDASPGEEIVVSFNNSRSQRPIRIYNLRGELLYQVWQDGGVSSFHWMSKAGLLVCAGGDEHCKDSPANRQAGTAVPGCIYAPVVFAIRPELTDPPTILREYLDLSGEKQPAVVWCSWFDPASSDLLQIDAFVSALVGTFDAGEYVRLNAKFQRSADQFGQMSMILTRKCTEVQAPNSRSEGDDYARSRGQGNVPDMDKLLLSATPPYRIWTTSLLPAPASQPAP